MVTDASEAGAPPVEVGASQLTILRQSDGELIVRGTKEQLDAAVRLLDQVGK